LGGGLAGALIALELAATRPELSVLLVEGEPAFGGNHIWSFFQSDVTPQDFSLVEPLIVSRWDGYDVHFQSHSRNLSTPYRAITSERLNRRLHEVLPEPAMLTGTPVVAATQTTFTLANGETYRTGGVIDARGARTLPHMQGGWQKFAGQMLTLEQPHGLDRPIVMDGRVEQIDGYRFVYCLPFSATEVFVEDTYYSDTPRLDLPDLRSRIAEYADMQGWIVANVSREETGVLPVIARGDFEAFWNESDNIARAGARAALIHPLTSYSLPIAVRVAKQIARMPNLSGAALAKASYDLARTHWRDGRFYRMLTRMLFSAAAPDRRHLILERFYRLPEGLIERFYAGRSRHLDAVRILSGKPPVPVGTAIASLTGHGRPLVSLELPK